MSTDLFTRRRKITLAIAFALAWPATWVAQILYFNTSENEIFSCVVLMAEDETRSLRSPRNFNNNEPSMIENTVKLQLITENSGWPFASFVFLSGSYIPKYEYWETGWGAISNHYYWYISDEAYSQFKEAIFASDNQQAIDAINGVHPPTGPRILGWVGNIFVWWILSYIGIALVLASARGTDKATHIPKELVQRDRAAQGLCPHCAYDIRALNEGQLCPECGKEPSEIAVSEAKNNPISDKETDKDDAAKVSCE